MMGEVGGHEEKLLKKGKKFMKSDLETLRSSSSCAEQEEQM